jgi:hypothetical protein
MNINSRWPLVKSSATTCKNLSGGKICQVASTIWARHTSILSLIYHAIFSNINYRLRHMAYKLQESLTFFRSNLIFSALGLISQPKNPCQPPKNTYNINMANFMPSPSLLSLAPHDVAWDGSFNRINSDPLPYVLDANFGDWTDADTDEVVALTRCDNGCLKACIIATLTSVWGVPEMFPAQIDAVFCLLHPMKPNHLAVIEQTSTGKTHILRMLGVIKRGIVLIFIPLLMLSDGVMSKFTCAAERFSAQFQ